MPNRHFATKLVIGTIVVLGWILILMPITTIRAATIIVTATLPGVVSDGKCSLIEAIINANDDTATSLDCPAGAGADVIELAGGEIYTLTDVDNNVDGPNGIPSITSDITVNGNGAIIARSTISGTSAFRIFHIAAGHTLQLNNLTIKNGLTTSSGLSGTGAGIFNKGTLKLNNTILSDNQAGSDGGGIRNVNGGLLEIVNSTLSNNKSSYSGGGINNQPSAMLIVINSNFNNNEARDGGAIYNIAGTLFVTNTAISSNKASVRGGGITSVDSTAQATLYGSVVNNNTANSIGGGGIYSFGVLKVYNSTISNNNGGVGGGGGIQNGGGTATLNGVTISGNSSSLGGGIRIRNSVSSKNSIIAGNSSPSGPDCRTDTSRFLTSEGHNLIQNTSNCSINGDLTGNIIGQAAQLGPLQDNGGPTFTQALLANSPAIDSADNAVCAIAPINNADQRGQTRSMDGNDDGVTNCDIGAYESHLIQVVKSASQSPAYLGEVITYTYRLENISSITLTNINAWDNRLEAINLISTSLSAGEVTTHSLTYTILTNDLPGPLVNTVTVTATTLPTNTVITTTDDAIVGIFPPPDLSIVKTTSLSVVVPGQTITYTLIFSNVGRSIASGVLITDSIPVSVTDINIVSSGVAITDISHSPAYLWQVQDLPPHQSGFITITGVPGNLLTTTTITNIVAIVSIDDESVLDNNWSEAGVTVLSPNTSPDGKIYLPIIFKD